MDNTEKLSDGELDALVGRIFNRPIDCPAPQYNARPQRTVFYKHALGVLAGMRRDDAPTRAKMAKLVRKIAQNALRLKIPGV